MPDQSVRAVATAARPVAEVIAWSRSLTQPALHAAVDRLPPALRLAAGYHFGWRDEAGQPASGYGGKALRPVLVLLAAGAVGGDPAAAVPAATAVELVHNSSLVHDDVIDHGATRRHRPAVWAVFGADTAILAGDALLGLAFDVLADDRSGARAAGVRMLHDAVQELLDGQLADTAAGRRTDIGRAESLRIADARTGALMAASCALGALAGGGGELEVDRLGRFGRLLGCAFQLVDDVLGIWGDTATTGRPRYSGLRTRRKSVPVAHTLDSGTPAGRELAELYARDDLTDVDLAYAAQLIATAGGRSWCHDEAERLLAAARRELEPLGRAGPVRAELLALADLVVHRHR